MSSAYPSALVFEAYLNSAWVSIVSYQVGPIRGRDGFGRVSFVDRTASQGSLNTKLNNASGACTGRRAPTRRRSP